MLRLFGQRHLKTGTGMIVATEAIVDRVTVSVEEETPTEDNSTEGLLWNTK